MNPKRGVVRFGKKEKLSPRFIGPFEVLERMDTVAYQLTLSPSMSGVHEVFHISMLREYTPDPAHVVDWGQIEVDTDGTFEEGPVYIVDSRDQVFATQDCEASKSAMTALWSGRVNVGGRGHDAGHLSLLV